MDGELTRLWRPGDDVAGHIAAIYREHDLVFDPDFEDDLFDIERVYAHGRFYVVEEAGQLLATAAVVPDSGFRLIRRMYVTPAGRRRGLAKRLVERCMTFGDFPATHLWSDVRFRAAHALYRSLGFQSGPTRVLTDPDRSVELYFSRWHR